MLPAPDVWICMFKASELPVVDNCVAVVYIPDLGKLSQGH
jgi:hypothetical protein